MATHDHSHAHGHGHSHAPATFDRAFAIGIALNLGFVVVGVIYGLWSNSLALLADAGHNASDALGLVLAWGAAWAARRHPTERFTYGYRRASILASLLNAVTLLVAVGVIAAEAAMRLRHPAPVDTGTVMAVAGIGIIVNGVTAWLFARGRKDDLNIRAAYLHMAGDALISAGVVAAALAIRLTGWLWIDPLVSLVVAAVIVGGTWSLLRESGRLSLDGVPAQIDAAAVGAYLRGLPGVTGTHDIHIWSMSTTEVALTAHLCVPATGPHDALLARIALDLEHHHGIGHATVQIEANAAACALEPADRV